MYLTSLDVDIHSGLQEEGHHVPHTVQTVRQVCEQGMQGSTAACGRHRRPIARTMGRLQPVLQYLGYREVGTAVSWNIQ